MIKKILTIIIGIAIIMTTSCKKFIEIQPEGNLSTEQTFKTADDAVSAIYGLYGLMQTLVDQIYLAGEVQGDLVVAARGADSYISEIAQNRITPNNPYTDYTKFYRLIIACNNAINGLKEINKIDPVNYNTVILDQNIAEVLYIRAWTYLQLIKIWDDVPFIDNSITTVEQIKDIPPSKSSVILDQIIKDAEGAAPLMLPLTSNNVDMKVKRSQFNPDAARCLLAELYLYADRYSDAWETIQSLSPYTYSNLLFKMTQFAGGESGTPLYAQYPNVFTATNNSYLFQSYWAFFIDFDGSKGQKNSLMHWTNNKNGGIYAIKPSPNIIKAYETTPMIKMNYQNTSAGYYIDLTKNGTNINPVLQADGFPVIGGYGDYIRGPGVAYLPDGQDTLIFKFLIKTRGIPKNSNDNDPNSNDDAMFPIYRDGPVYLMACEILNNLGLSDQALLIMNGTYGSDFLQGTRYRVRAAPLKIDSSSTESKQKQVDRLILQEKALEASFEGMRWFDLVRFAKRYNDPSIIADAVAKKYPVNQQAAIKARLSNPDYWYFPYYKRNVEANKLLPQKPGY
jgi:starch-binding outer membrane protein, SusD/RagB family